MKIYKIITILSLVLCSSSAFGQAKKPTLMVVPSDQWCQENGFIQTFDNQGTQEQIPDYGKAFLNNKDLNNVVTKINALMADKGFPMKDMAQTVKSITSTSAEDMVLRSKTTGATIAESPIDRLRRTAKADILLYIDWTINRNGPKTSITYNLKGMDAYSNKQVAGAEGTGAQSFSTELPVLLEEAVLNNMDIFCAQLQTHFDDLLTNGREVSVDIRVFDNDSGLDLEKDYNGEELTEIIDAWMEKNTVSHRFSKADATENYIMYDQVRIPLYKPNGMAMDTESFTRQLSKFLRAEPYNIQNKVINRGLGRCLLILGAK